VERGVNQGGESVIASQGFTSSSPRDVSRFLDQFLSRNSLFEWMETRPKGKARVLERPGDKRVVVVVPTANASGQLATNCRDSVFRGLHLVFVESGLPLDPLFNLSHNINVGFQKALEYDPNWIVFASDDMIRIDGPEVLLKALLKVDNEKFDTVFTSPEGRYHSVYGNLGRPNMARKLLFGLAPSMREVQRHEKRLGVELIAARNSGIERALFHPGYKFWSTASFGIFSRSFVAGLGGLVYHEGFINAAEDIELSLRLNRDASRLSFVRYRVAELVGASLGRGAARRMRTVACNAYLNYLISQKPSKYFPDGFNFEWLTKPSA
jgi:hypothetical protein